MRRKKAVLSIATKLQIVERAKNGESVSNLSSEIKLHDIAPIRVFVNFKNYFRLYAIFDYLDDGRQSLNRIIEVLLRIYIYAFFGNLGLN